MTSQTRAKSIAKPDSEDLLSMVAGDERGRSLVGRAIELALEEDIGGGDITTAATVDKDRIVRAEVWFKQPGVLAGLPVFSLVFAQVDPRVRVTFDVPDGTFVESPRVVAGLNGPAGSIVTGERVALNFLQRLSGIATATRRFTEKAQAAGISILDTRKTTPALRTFERYAVKVAGGVNHRFNLSDAILIKDNHVRLAGGIREAIRKAKTSNPSLRLEVETTNADEVRIAVEEAADAILLDNMTANQIREAVSIIAGRSFIEVSGGVNLANIDSYLIAGVNAISIGAITHSSGSIDISLEIED